MNLEPRVARLEADMRDIRDRMSVVETRLGSIEAHMVTKADLQSAINKIMLAGFAGLAGLFTLLQKYPPAPPVIEVRLPASAAAPALAAPPATATERSLPAPPGVPAK